MTKVLQERGDRDKDAVKFTRWTHKFIHIVVDFTQTVIEATAQSVSAKMNEERKKETERRLLKIFFLFAHSISFDQ